MTQDVGAERRILGAIMEDSDLIFVARQYILPDDFADNKHGLIFDAMMKLAEDTNPIRPSLLNVTDKLSEMNWLDKVGGAEYIKGLVQDVRGLAHSISMDTPVWCEKVAELAHRRSFLRMLPELQAKAEDLSMPVDDLQSELIRYASFGKKAALNYEAIGDKFGMDEFETAVENWLQGINSKAVYTGLSELDYHLVGLGRGDLTIVGARPSMGKTLVMENIANNVAARGGVVAIESIEMSTFELRARQLSRVAGIDSLKLRRGMYQNDVDAQKKIRAALLKMRGCNNVFANDMSSPKTIDIHHRAIMLYMKHEKLDLHCVDYIELIGDVVDADENLRQSISMSYRRLKAIAKGLDCASLVLSQLRKTVDDRPSSIPTMSDLIFTGEAEADNIILLWYPWRIASKGGTVSYQKGIGYRERGVNEPYPEDLFLFIMKARDGEIGHVRVHADLSHGIIRDREDYKGKLPSASDVEDEF